jgi:hypothetical protein
VLTSRDDTTDRRSAASGAAGTMSKLSKRASTGRSSNEMDNSNSYPFALKLSNGCQLFSPKVFFSTVNT